MLLLSDFLFCGNVLTPLVVVGLKADGGAEAGNDLVWGMWGVYGVHSRGEDAFLYNKVSSYYNNFVDLKHCSSRSQAILETTSSALEQKDAENHRKRNESI